MAASEGIIAAGIILAFDSPVLSISKQVSRTIGIYGYNQHAHFLRCLRLYLTISCTYWHWLHTLQTFYNSTSRPTINDLTIIRRKLSPNTTNLALPPIVKSIRLLDDLNPITLFEAQVIGLFGCIRIDRSDIYILRTCYSFGLRRRRRWFLLLCCLCTVG